MPTDKNLRPPGEVEPQIFHRDHQTELCSAFPLFAILSSFFLFYCSINFTLCATPVPVTKKFAIGSPDMDTSPLVSPTATGEKRMVSIVEPPAGRL